MLVWGVCLAGCLDLVKIVYTGGKGNLCAFLPRNLDSIFIGSVCIYCELLLGLNPKVGQQATYSMRSLRCTCFYLSSLCPQT